MTEKEFYQIWKSPANNTWNGHEANLPFSWWTHQYEKEFWPLLKAMQDIGARKIVEIGSNHGGSLSWFDRIAGPDGITIGIDAAGDHEHTFTLFRPQFCSHRATSDLRLLSYRSDDPACLAEVQEIMDGEIDAIFIDADHAYESVETDFNIYAPLVRSGGIVGFHDILHVPEGSGRHWNEVVVPLPGRTELFGVEGNGLGVGIWWKP